MWSKSYKIFITNLPLFINKETLLEENKKYESLYCDESERKKYSQRA